MLRPPHLGVRPSMVRWIDVLKDVDAAGAWFVLGQWKKLAKAQRHFCPANPCVACGSTSLLDLKESTFSWEANLPTAFGLYQWTRCHSLAKSSLAV